MTQYKKCEVCGALLLKNKLTGEVCCELCGWSPNEESDRDEPIGVG